MEFSANVTFLGLRMTFADTRFSFSALHRTKNHMSIIQVYLNFFILINSCSKSNIVNPRYLKFLLVEEKKSDLEIFRHEDYSVQIFVVCKNINHYK